MAGIPENPTGLTENTTGIVEARNISFAYNRSPVLKDLSFILYEGDVMFIGGESGSGKTTLLRLLVGLESPGNGELLFRGLSYARISLPALRKRVAYLQQLPVMIDASVRENLLLSFRYDRNDPADDNNGDSSKGEHVLKPGAHAVSPDAHVTRPDAHVVAPPDDSELLAKLAGARLDTVGLDQPARELSVGQQQRISLLRLLSMCPAVLLLDEPLAALDETSAKAMLELLTAEIRQRGTAIMLVSHVLPGILETRSRRMTLINGILKEAHT